MLGIDITIVPPATELSSSSPISPTACSQELFLRVRGEKKKFCHDGKTDKENGISYSGDESMGLIERDNIVLIPDVVTPHGHTGPLSNRFLYEHDAEPRQIFKNRPNANTCEDSARSSNISHNMLGANHIWRASHPHEFYGRSCLQNNGSTPTL